MVECDLNVKLKTLVPVLSWGAPLFDDSVILNAITLFGMDYIPLIDTSVQRTNRIKNLNQNSLQLFDLTGYDELALTELENCMIALNIIFQKSSSG